MPIRPRSRTRKLIFALRSPIMVEVDAQQQNGALLIAACMVAAIRLRGEPIRPSPKLMSTIADAVQLARLVLREIER